MKFKVTTHEKKSSVCTYVVDCENEDEARTLVILGNATKVNERGGDDGELEIDRVEIAE